MKRTKKSFMTFPVIFLFVLALILPIGKADATDITSLEGYTGEIGNEDIFFGTGQASDTFSIPTDDGTTTTLTKIPGLTSSQTSILKGTWYVSSSASITDHGDATQYGSLAWVASIVGSGNYRIVIPSAAGTLVIGTNLTIASNIALEIEQGAILSPSITKTLTINGPFSAGDYHVFSGAGSVVFGTGAIQNCPMVWFYSGTGAIDSAVTAAFASVSAVHGAEVLLPSGSWLTTTGLLVDKGVDAAKQNRLRGTGEGSSVLKANADNIAIVGLGDLARISDMTLDGNGHAGIYGIEGRGSRCHAENIEIKNCARAISLVKDDTNSFGRGVKSATNYGTFRKIKMREGNPSGVWLETEAALLPTAWINNNQFYDCEIQSTTQYAVYLNGASGNLFMGGDIEQNTGIGYRLVSGQGNQIMGTWFEANTGGDIYRTTSYLTAGFVAFGSGLDSYAVFGYTTGTINAGSTTLTVASANNLAPGKSIRVAGAGVAGGNHDTYITAISGTTITLADAAITTVGAPGAVNSPVPESVASSLIMGAQYLSVHGTVMMANPTLGMRNGGYFQNTIEDGFYAKGTGGDFRIALESGITTFDVRDYSTGNLLLSLTNTGTNGNLLIRGGLGVGNSAAGDVTGTAKSNKIEVFNSAGVSLGYIQVYAGP